ncbi:hypothetical protein FRAHR75_330078 [Frankia sp. Hr75.2]|nr:hypothetical protein FRAHR75_330078 [Frankia sp. Hr75.2]
MCGRLRVWPWPWPSRFHVVEHHVFEAVLRRALRSVFDEAGGVSEGRQAGAVLLFVDLAAGEAASQNLLG